MALASEILRDRLGFSECPSLLIVEVKCSLSHCGIFLLPYLWASSSKNMICLSRVFPCSPTSPGSPDPSLISSWISPYLPLANTSKLSEDRNEHCRDQNNWQMAYPGEVYFLQILILHNREGVVVGVCVIDCVHPVPGSRGWWRYNTWKPTELTSRTLLPPVSPLPFNALWLFQIVPQLGTKLQDKSLLDIFHIPTIAHTKRLKASVSPTPQFLENVEDSLLLAFPASRGPFPYQSSLCFCHHTPFSDSWHSLPLPYKGPFHYAGPTQVT